MKPEHERALQEIRTRLVEQEENLRFAIERGAAEKYPRSGLPAKHAAMALEIEALDAALAEIERASREAEQLRIASTMALDAYRGGVDRPALWALMLALSNTLAAHERDRGERAGREPGR